MSVGEFLGWFAAAVFCGFLVGEGLCDVLVWAMRPRKDRDGWKQ